MLNKCHFVCFYVCVCFNVCLPYAHMHRGETHTDLISLFQSYSSGFSCNVCTVCVYVWCLCEFLCFLSVCVGNSKANSVNSNLMSSLKMCLGQKTDSDNQITAGRILETYC